MRTPPTGSKNGSEPALGLAFVARPARYVNNVEMLSGESDLNRLLSALSPRLHDGVYVFCEVARGRAPVGIEPLLTFQETEGTTVVITKQQADQAGLVGAFPSVWITLGATSDLAAVGFLAVVTARLAAEGISTNVVSAFRHDHIFVPVPAADRAMAVLTELEKLHRPRVMEPTPENPA